MTDNQQTGNPSGVLRAYDAITGQFAWAWDMGNPGYHGLPDEGGEYTRGTPNVWSNTAYDPVLNYVFAPTGNSSPGLFRRHAALEGSRGECIFGRGYRCSDGRAQVGLPDGPSRHLGL